MCSTCHRLSHASFTLRNVEALKARFWSGVTWWGPGHPLTVQNFREFMDRVAKNLRAAYVMEKGAKT